MPIIALATSGMQTVQGKPCIKCIQNVPITLLRLFSDCATNLTPPGTTYSYIHLPGVRLTQRYLVLNLTEPEKAIVEELARPQSFAPHAYVWDEETWYEFPYQDNFDYRV